MLKESVSPAVATPAPTSGRGGGVVLRARPVRAPPAGVKVFTLNNARALTKEPVPVASAAATAPTVVVADTKKTSSQDVQAITNTY